MALAALCSSWTMRKGRANRSALFSKTIMISCRILTINANYVDFTKADIANTDFDGTALGGAKFNNTTLKGVSFIGTQLGYSDASEFKTVFKGAKIEKANFTRADLYFVDFSEAQIKDSIFRGARYNSYTKWPKGFDPKRHGMIWMKYIPPLWPSG